MRIIVFLYDNLYKNFENHSALIIVTVKKLITGYLTNMKTFHNQLTGTI